LRFIVIKQGRAVARAHLALSSGAVPLLLVTAAWCAAAILAPSAYGRATVGYVSGVAACLGIGLRLHLSSYRAYLIPGFREAQRIVALGLMLAAVLIGSLAGSSGLPALLLAAGLWLWGLALMYWVGLSRKWITLLDLLLVLLLFLVRTLVRGILPSGLDAFGTGSAALLLAGALALTVLVWRQFGRVRGAPWIGAQVHVGRNPFGESTALDSIAGLMPAGFFGQLRHFQYSTRSGARRFYVLALIFAALMLPARFLMTSDEFVAAAFSVHMLLPTAAVLGFLVRVPQSMFVLPLSRAEIVNRWGGALFLSVMQYWTAFALPLGVALLIAGPRNAVPVSLPALLGTTLASQLPIFGLGTILLCRHTRSGVRLSILFALLLLFVPAVVAPIAINGVPIQQTIFWSLLTGPVLIAFSYSHWRTAEAA
jgi:hypothetical protein